jgi:PPOX class probable F420-dependent enzyme
MLALLSEGIMSSHPYQRATPIEDRLRTEPTVWLSSTRPDGRPHVVPVWFNWDGKVFDLFSKPTAQKVRNLREHPDAMLAIGQPDEEFDVELVEGKAVVLDKPTAEVISSSMFDKYADLMARAGLDKATYVNVYSQPIRIQPTRFLGYGGKGWVEPAGGDDVAGHMIASPPGPPLSPAQLDAAAEIVRVVRGFRSGISPELLALQD